MAGNQILTRGLQPTHELMAEWILQNPGGTLREMGAYFGYSPSWLSQVINTDMFKAHMAERLGDVKAYVSMDVPEKMRLLADQAIERVQEVLEKTEDAELIVSTFDKVMHRYGYAPNARNAVQPQGPSAGPGQVNNVFFLSQEQFQRVQTRLIQSHEDAPAQPAEVSSLPQPKEVESEDDKRPVPSDT